MLRIPKLYVFGGHCFGNEIHIFIPKFGQNSHFFPKRFLTASLQRDSIMGGTVNIFSGLVFLCSLTSLISCENLKGDAIITNDNNNNDHLHIIIII